MILAPVWSQMGFGNSPQAISCTQSFIYRKLYYFRFLEMLWRLVVSQMISRFLPQSATVGFFVQRTSLKLIRAKLHRVTEHLSRFVTNGSPQPITQRFVRLNHAFQNNQPDNSSWIVLLAVALVAATLANQKADAEEVEADLSWEELEKIALLFDVNLPITRDPETFKKTAHKCFYAVFQACHDGDWTLIDQISEATLSKLTDTWGQTLLIAAAGEGNNVAVEGLIKRQIALQKTDRDGNTPLHAAAKNGFSHLVPLLCDYYIKDLNSQGKNAHHIAVEYGHLAVLKTLIAKNPKSDSLKEGNLSLTLLALCIRHSKHDCLDFLLKQPGYRLEESSQLGTLLHVAIHFGQFSTLRHLVGCSGAAILLQKQDDQGRNPLALAAFVGDLEAVDFLYQKVGNWAGHNGWSAAHWAVIGKQGEVLKLLAYLGMNLEIRDGEGKRPEDLLKDDTSFEAKQIKNILNGLIQNRDQIQKSPLDFRSQPPEGIVFKGGGPRGLAYLEALRALKGKKALDEVQRTAGTSAGAITAAIFALDPQLKDIDSLENLDLMQFLDPVKGKEPLLNAMLAAKDKEGTISKIVSGSFEIAKGAWNPLKLYNAFSQLDGICEGENLRKWVESEIYRRTGKEHCTFGELKQEIQRGKKFLHLHVYATRLEAGPDKKILHFSSENPEWDNIVISDAIRASMSIPGVYQPYTVREKTRSNTLVSRTDLGPCVDGGLIKNFPIDAFDVPTDGYYSSFNRRTLGLCLKDVEGTSSKTPPVSGILDIAKACASVYWTAEETYVSTEENRHRTIEIPIKGVELCDFNLTKEQKAGLLKAGRDSIENDSSPFAKARESDVFVHMKASNVPTSLPFFTGRQQELRSLEQTFISDPPASNDTIVRLIYGLPGMGKTELTRAFARNHQQDFSIIWFIDSATIEQKNQSYRGLAEKLNISILDKESPQQIERKVHARLQNHTYDKPWLLIFDNVEEKISVPQGGYVLMTSRNREVWRNEKEWIHLDKFEQKDSLKILADITGKRSSRLAELAQELGHFPLALNQAAHYIQSANCSIEEYLTVLKKNPVLGKMEPDERYKRTLQNVWHITLEKLEKDNPQASAWLKVCAHLNPDDIPQEWLTDWLEKQTGVEDWDKMEITRTLTGLSLIRSQGEEYSMHRLMQLVVRGETNDHFERAYELVSSQYPKRRNVQGYKCDEKWLAQAISVAGSPLVGLINRLKLADMLDHIGLKLTSLGNHVDALKHHQQALDIRKMAQPPKPRDIAMSHNNIGATLSNLGEHKAALKHHQEALKIRKEAQPPKLCDIAMSHNNIGATLSNLGEHEAALKHHQEALKIRKEAQPPKLCDIAMSHNNIGATLSNLGEHEAALKHHQEALKIRKEARLPTHIAMSHNNIGATFSNLGEHEAALEHHQEALKIRKEARLPTHIAMSHNNIGATFSNLGEHEAALEHHQEALKIRKDSLPPTHPDLAMSYHNTGAALSNLERHAEALEHHREALKIRKETLPPNHPYIAMSYNNVGISLRDLGQHQEALEHQQKALEICASQENHPDHELYLENFIDTLNKQTDNQVCEKAKQEILALYTEKLGEDHALSKELKAACPKRWTFW